MNSYTYFSPGSRSLPHTEVALLTHPRKYRERATKCILTLLLLCLGLPASMFKGQTPTRRPFYLAQSTDPDYETLVHQRFPSIAALDSYADIKRTSVLVVNGTKTRLLALSLRWELTGADGKTAILYTREIIEHSSTHFVPGSTALLNSGQVALISPIAHAEEAIDRTPLQQAERFVGPYTHPGIYANLANSTMIGVSLDAAIFASGIIIGPDNAGLGARLTVERNGALEELQSLNSLMASEALLSSRLITDSSARLPSGYSQPEALARRDAAQQLMFAFQHGGLAHIKAIQARALSTRPILLRRMKSATVNPQ